MRHFANVANTADYKAFDEVRVLPICDEAKEIIGLDYDFDKKVDAPISRKDLGTSFIGKHLSDLELADSEAIAKTRSYLRKISLLRMGEVKRDDLAAHSIKLTDYLKNTIFTEKQYYDELIEDETTEPRDDVFYQFCPSTDFARYSVRRYRQPENETLYLFYEGSSFAKPIKEIFDDLKSTKNN